MVMDWFTFAGLITVVAFLGVLAFVCKTMDCGR